uniref:Peptidase S1 domain-containing protein n=1 Tax=Pelusios castaneus TaxID=367368 RepID=A0A8C8S223_9SAUR
MQPVPSWEIIGGWEAKPHSRPYMAYLNIKHGNKNYNCGGFLVSENFVLTAAHCNGDKITVTLGAHNIRENERSQQVIRTFRQFSHPDYDNQPHNNDIMLLQLAQKAKLNKWVRPITLPFAKQRVKPGTKCSVAGWGRIRANDDKSASDKLQEVNVEVLKDGQCLNNPNGAYKNYNSTTMLCAGDSKEKKDSAKGDSGGPLVCGKRALGIVSWGPYFPPGVYTKISTFIPWIQETMKRLQP